MISINNALTKIINESPFLEDGLYHEYINLTSLSVYLKPQIENITKKDITIGAIKMALSRYIKEKKTTIKYKRFDVENFFIKKNIGVIYLKNDSKKFDFLSNIEIKSGDYLTTVQGSKNATIIYNESIKEDVENLLPRKNIDVKIDDLSLVGVYLEDGYVNEIGIIYTLTKKINFSNINIIELISNYKEIHLIVKNEDLKRTIEALMS